MTIDAGGWDRVKQVFQSALERSSETRPAFLDAACGDDRSLRAVANVSPAFDGIRDDPRFKALVARLKLPN